MLFFMPSTMPNDTPYCCCTRTWYRSAVPRIWIEAVRRTAVPPSRRDGLPLSTVGLSTLWEVHPHLRRQNYLELVWCRGSFAALKGFKSTQASGGELSRRSLGSCNLVSGEAQTSPIDSSPPPCLTVRTLNARPRRAHQHYNTVTKHQIAPPPRSIRFYWDIILYVMLDCFFMICRGK